MMTQSILSGLAVLLLAACATAQNSGYATYSNGNGGVCDGVSSGLPAVAMNAAQFGGGAACGQCVQIQGTGNGAGKTPVSTAPYIAVVNNICPQCAVGDIDLQESGSGKFGITWSFVACPGAGRRLIEGRKMISDTVQPVAEFRDVAEQEEEASAQQQPQEATTQQAAADEAEATPAASPVQAAEEATDATLAETTETTKESTQTAAAPSQEDSAAPAAAPVEEPAMEVEAAASPAASPAASSGPQATSRRMLR